MNIAQTLQQAVSHHQAGELPQAEALYQGILKVDPNHSDALHLLGLISHQSGNHAQAESLISKAISFTPTAPMYCNLGVVLQAAGKFEQAINAYQTSINKGQNDASVFFNLANTYKAQKNFKSAIPYYQQALSISPDFVAAYYNLGNAFKEIDSFDQAIESYNKALSIVPDDIDTLTNLGLTLHALDKPDEAISCYQKIFNINPNLTDNLLNMGNALLLKLQFTEAARNYQQAIVIDPTFSSAYNNLGKIYQNLGMQDKAIETYRQALAIQPDLFMTHSNLIFTLDMHPDMKVAALQQERKEWACRHADTLLQNIPHLNSRQPDRKLRIGYVSADFKQHSATCVFGAMLMDFDKERFEVTAYSNSRKYDSYTQLMQQNASCWRNIVALSDDELANQIREDQIDILIDLSGHSDGNRLLAFARKPAPIQITAWGYIGGTGMKAMDVFFADPIVVPPEERHLYAEDVVYLPNVVNYFAFTPFPPVGALPALSVDSITFGSCNRLAKLTKETFQTWARVLCAVPNSRMLMKTSELDDDNIKRQILDSFVQEGVSSERITLLGRSSWVDHMAAFNQVDISLDPYPHGGGVTTLEGIMMGVPVVTLRWPTIPGRLSAAVLTPLGLTDWIAETPEQYVDIAVKKASDLMALAVLRKQLRKTMTNSLVGDSNAYAREVEKIYRQLWQQWCSQSITSIET